MPLLAPPPDFSLSSDGEFTNGFLRMGFLCVSAPGTEPSSAPALARAFTEGGRWNQRTLVVGVWVPSRRSPGPEELEQLREPPLVGACTLPAAVLPLQALGAHMCASCDPHVQARGVFSLRATLSGQTSRPTPHHLCGHISNKPKALGHTEGCPPRPRWT